MNELIQRVPKYNHYAILQVGHSSEVVDYGPPDRPYTEQHDYLEYEWIGDKDALEVHVNDLIARNKKPGVDFVVLAVTPLSVQTKTSIEFGSDKL
jgi:hypothetical protein